MKRIEINNDEGLEKALLRLDEIWSAQPGEPNFEERGLLVELIVAYEDKNYPIPPPDPEEVRLFRLEQSGLKLTKDKNK